MTFAQSPVLLEFGFGLMLMAVVPLGRFFRLNIYLGLLPALLSMSALAWWFSAPFSLLIFLGLSVALILAHPVLSRMTSALWAFLQPRVSGSMAVSVVVGLAGLFLVLAPAHIVEMIEVAQAKEFEESIDGGPDLRPLEDLMGATDKGEPIGLYVSGSEYEGDDIQWLREHDFDFHLMRLEGADNESNCHGHVFTSGRYWVLGRDVPAILLGNGYAEIGQPLPGDLVVYRDTQGVVTHTGIVRACGEGFPTLVESKWGKFGVYIHPAERTPYVGPMAYYRANRPGGSHQIQIKEAQAGE